MRTPILKSKRGIALESAILFMVMVFSFCFLLTSLALFGHYSVKLQQIKAEIDVEIEQIGEDFVYYLSNTKIENINEQSAEAALNGKYTVEANFDNAPKYALTIKTAKGTTLLFIEAQKQDNGAVTVLAWTVPES